MGEVKLPESIVKDIVEQLRRDQTLSHTRFMDYMKAERDYNRSLLELHTKHLTDLINGQNLFNEAQLKLLGEYLEKASIMYEKALNPPLPPTIPDDERDMLFAQPRMSEEEEDLRYSLQMGDITQSEFDDTLKKHFANSYTE